MPKLYARILLLVCLAVPVLPASAALVSGLYESTIEVPDRSMRARRTAYRDALEEVLVRVTGRRDLNENTPAYALLSTAERFIQQFRYLSDESLWVRFDSESVNEALGRVGERVWGPERPSVLMWLALDNGRGARAILAAEDQGEIPQLLEQTSMERGLPVIRPLMDSEDLLGVSFVDVWGGFDEKVLEASARYGTDGVLIGRGITDELGDWTVRWTLIMGADARRTIGGLGDGIEMAADVFASQFAVNVGLGGNEVLVRVAGIESLRDYGSVGAYLEGLSVVQNVSVQDVFGDTVTYRLALKGDQHLLERTIGLGDTLVPGNTAAENILPYETSQRLHFQYRR